MAFTSNALCFGSNLPASGMPCRIEATPAGFSVQFHDAVAEIIPFAELSFGVGGFEKDQLVMKWMYKGNSRTAYVKDADVMKSLQTSVPVELLSQLGRVTDQVRRNRTKRNLALGILGVLAAALLFCLWWSFDSVVSMVVHRIPVEWEEAIGESARRHILDEQTIIADGEAVRAVQTIVRRLTNEIPDTPYRFRITLVGRDMVNAVAFPGGFIVVFTGLLQQAETPEEVAGVLAHEINHVLLRHGLHGTVKNLGLLAAVHIVFGNQDGLVELTQRLGIELTRLTFSRKMETEADLAGLDLLHRANISPSGMIRFFERLAKSERANRVEWLSTHPMSAARVERLESYEANHATSAFTPIQVDWKTVQAEF